MLEIKSGFNSSTQLIFENEGHEFLNRKKSKLIFNIIEISQPNFIRIDNDLIYNTDIALHEAISCKNI
jgi:DnaJ-class molecular chaperone